MFFVPLCPLMLYRLIFVGDPRARLALVGGPGINPCILSVIFTELQIAYTLLYTYYQGYKNPHVRILITLFIEWRPSGHNREITEP